MRSSPRESMHRYAVAEDRLVRSITGDDAPPQANLCSRQGSDVCRPSKTDLARGSPANGACATAAARISCMLRGVALGVLLTGLCDVASAVDPEIDRYVDAEMALNSIPGLSLAVVEGGAVSYLQAYGVRSVESQEAMRVDTPVELASVSKAFTALAVLHLEQAGRVDRDAAVTAFLPELGYENWRGVTLRDLLRHRSGLRRRHDFLIPCCGHPRNLELDRAAERMAGADLESPPGVTFSYANSNYVLLAAVVQRVSGVPFPDYMRETIFRPLGMQRTTVEEEEARSWNVADPHEWQWGRVGVSPSQFRGWFGSSRVKASAADMGAYLTALLDPESTDVGVSPLGPAWWERMEPEYALGWAVRAEAEWLDGELVLEHTGKIWGGHTAVVLAPRRQAGVAVLVNLGTNSASRVARAVLLSRYGSPLPEPRRMSRVENPDTWAGVFLASTVGLFPVLLWYGTRVARQVRRDIRAWHPTGWRVARAALLTGLAAKLIHSALWSSGPPHAALPTTIRLALPALVACVTALLLLAAVVGLVPRSSS